MKLHVQNLDRFCVIFNTFFNQFSRYDLQEVLQSKVDAHGVKILKPHRWPKVEEVVLNKSQLEAIQAALTKEFVVIQGPPGTGKTYVGLKIVQALLKNQKYWRGCEPQAPARRQRAMLLGEPEEETRVGSPMLVVCYTNHALDQFLEGGCMENCCFFVMVLLVHAEFFLKLSCYVRIV